MAKAKSKEFILKRWQRRTSDLCNLDYVNRKNGMCLCYRNLHRDYGITLKPGEKKRVRITIEEVK